MGTLPCFRLFFHFSNVLADVSDVFRKRVKIKALPMFEVLYGRPFWLCLFIFLMLYDCFQFACLFFYVLNVSHVFKVFRCFLGIRSCMVSLVVFLLFLSLFLMGWRRTINRGTDLSWTVKIILYSIYLFWGWTALVRCS